MTKEIEISDEVVEKARRILHADVDPSGWVTDDEIRAAVRAAITADRASRAPAQEAGEIAKQVRIASALADYSGPYVAYDLDDAEAASLIQSYGDAREAKGREEAVAWENAEWFYADDDPDVSDHNAYNVVFAYGEETVVCVKATILAGEKFGVIFPAKPDSDSDDPECVWFDSHDEAAAAIRARKGGE